MKIEFGVLESEIRTELNRSLTQLDKQYPTGSILNTLVRTVQDYLENIEPELESREYKKLVKDIAIAVSTNPYTNRRLDKK